MMVSFLRSSISEFIRYSNTHILDILPKKMNYYIFRYKFIELKAFSIF
jgi:hypothetical protein